jgi:hypothetical protein
MWIFTVWLSVRGSVLDVRKYEKVKRMQSLGQHTEDRRYERYEERKVTERN